MKKFFGLMFVFILLATSMIGCGSKSKLDPKDPVTLTMWHNYGGDMQEAMDYLAKGR